MRIGVIGAGSWGTALVKIFSGNGHHVNWWMHNKTSVEHMNKYHHNPKYLQSVEFDITKLTVTNHLDAVVTESDLLVVATPAAFMHGTFEKMDPKKLEGKLVFSAVKGMVPEFYSIPANYFHEQFKVPFNNIGIICGPCHAEEVALERLSYLTIACENNVSAQAVADKLQNRFIKTTTSDDLMGTELAAILKNIYALASGVFGGLGYGDNFQAVFISNCVQELEKFIDTVHPIHRDVKTSAYLGDLLVTAYSKFSRNRTFGYMIGQGYSVKAAQLEMQMVAEGYYAVKSIYEMNKKYQIDVPIINAVHNILYEKISPAIEMRILTESLS